MGISIPTYGHSGYVTITGDKAASPSRNCFAFLERQSFLEFWRLHRKILLLSLAVTQQKATTQEDSLCVSVRQCSSGLSGGIRARDLTEKGPVSCACVCVCVFYSSESQWSRPSLIMSSQTSRHPNRIPCVDVGWGGKWRVWDSLKLPPYWISSNTIRTVDMVLWYMCACVFPSSQTKTWMFCQISPHLLISGWSLSSLNTIRPQPACLVVLAWSSDSPCRCCKGCDCQQWT